MTLKGEDLHLEGKPVRFRRRFPGKERRLRDLPLRRRPKEPKPGDWKKLKFGDGICSHPPEDIAVERFGNRLRRRAIRLLSEESRRVAPFTTSLLDGIDVRESLRHHHEGRLWVYEEARVRGGAGSVVVIFDEEAEKYPWKTTWLGEHGQESDMAFYATPLGESVVGPGISECTYGGFLMTMPPGRLFDVWHDPDYRGPFTGARGPPPRRPRLRPRAPRRLRRPEAAAPVPEALRRAPRQADRLPSPRVPLVALPEEAPPLPRPGESRRPLLGEGLHLGAALRQRPASGLRAGVR